MPHLDATLKDIVAEHLADFVTTFGLAGRGPLTLLNVDLSTVSAATDIVFQCGDPPGEIVDLNFQSGVDRLLPNRLHLYSSLLNFRYDAPVRTILVLLRDKADAANLTGNFAYAIGDEGVEFRYKVIRLWELPSDKLLHGGLGTMPLSLLCEMTDNKKPSLEAMKDAVRVIDARLQAEAEPAQAVKLMTATYVLAGLRVDLDELKEIFAGVITMPASTAFDAMIERGEIKNSHRLLLRLGRTRFGEPDAATEAALIAITDLDRLERLADAILTACSWNELLATP